jgi:hypothetical protein
MPIMNKTAWLAIAALQLLLASGQAWAKVQVLEEDDESIKLLDLNSIKKTGTQRRVMITTVYALATELPDSGGKNYQSADADILLDCKKNQYAMQKMNVYDPNGKVLGSRQFPKLDWKPLRPGYPVVAASATACDAADTKARVFDSIDQASKDFIGRKGRPVR